MQNKFLLITRTFWHEPPRARHQLADALSRIGEVVFIENNYWGLSGSKVTIINDKLKLISPSWFLPGIVVMRLPLINELYQLWLNRKILSNYINYTVIVFDPSFHLMHKELLKNSIYYCTDDFINIKRSKSILVAGYWSYTENKLARLTGFNIGVSKYLVQKLQKKNTSYLLLTAATLEKYNKSKGLIVYNKPSNSKIKIVYVGWTFKLNIDWVEYIACDSNLDITIVGPYDHGHCKKLKLFPNVKFVGSIVAEPLGKIISDSDVCIAPYNFDEDTEYVYTMPNKFWLYLKYGKPIVTVEIKNLAQLPSSFVYQSKTKKEFHKNIYKAVDENSASVIQGRHSFIAENTWGARAEELLKICKKHF